MRAGEPFLAGGGAVRYVGTDTVLWADLPDRQEAGSPNVVGAVALGVACRTMAAADLDRIARAETALLDDARARLAAVPGVEILQLWPSGHPRIGVLPFVLRSMPYAQLAAALSAEHGIGVRHGCFCAHRLMARLLRIDAAQGRRHRGRAAPGGVSSDARGGPRQRVRAENLSPSLSSTFRKRPRHHRPDESQQDRPLWPSDSST